MINMTFSNMIDMRKYFSKRINIHPENMGEKQDSDKDNIDKL